MSFESTYYSLDDLSADESYQSELYSEAFRELSLNAPDPETVYPYEPNPDEVSSEASTKKLRIGAIIADEKN
ncbi:16531_t:CDS:2 [Gigaspora rosea]|nr:16531_t:CDS:2 [Gigaspora rosea]